LNPLQGHPFVIKRVGPPLIGCIIGFNFRNQIQMELPAFNPTFGSRFLA
jgi:hypothetical protein